MTENLRDVIDAALQETLRGHTWDWWQCRRAQWGGLSAQQLADMGCYATLVLTAKELIDRRNEQLGEGHALWFPGNLLELSAP